MLHAAFYAALAKVPVRPSPFGVPANAVGVTEPVGMFGKEPSVDGVPQYQLAHRAEGHGLDFATQEEVGLGAGGGASLSAGNEVFDLAWRHSRTVHPCSAGV
jgi:hypothetical protein